MRKVHLPVAAQKQSGADDKTLVQNAWFYPDVNILILERTRTYIKLSLSELNKQGQYSQGDQHGAGDPFLMMVKEV
jgi:hypothetical protein